MASLICIIILSVVLIASLVVCILSKNKNSSATIFSPIILAISFVLICIITLCSTVVKVNPSEIAYAYKPDGSSVKLHTGYNMKSPLSKVVSIETKSCINTFSEGEESDNTFGAQTSDKDYIQIVATISYRVDPDRISEYVVRYGTKTVGCDEIYKLIKSEAKKASESVINKRTTADVISNKAQVNEDARVAFIELMKSHPIIIDSFTIDDTVAPESYEETIKQQAAIRQNQQTAELQKELNAKTAEANKIKADGEAEVAKINAQKDLDVAKINAEKDASVATINANNNAEVAKINAQKDAEVKKINSDAEILRSENEAEAKARIMKTESEAEAEKTKTLADAEAHAIEVAGEAYKNNPDLYEIKKAEIVADVQKAWAEKWAGIDMSGISPTISYADFSDILNGIIASYTNTNIVD